MTHIDLVVENRSSQVRGSRQYERAVAGRLIGHMGQNGYQTAVPQPYSPTKTPHRPSPLSLTRSAPQSAAVQGRCCHATRRISPRATTGHRQRRATVVLFVVVVVVVGASVKITVAVWTSTCVTITVRVVGVWWPSKSSFTWPLCPTPQRPRRRGRVRRRRGGRRGRRRRRRRRHGRRGHSHRGGHGRHRRGCGGHGVLAHLRAPQTASFEARTAWWARTLTSERITCSVSELQVKARRRVKLYGAMFIHFGLTKGCGTGSGCSRKRPRTYAGHHLNQESH